VQDAKGNIVVDRSFGRDAASATRTVGTAYQVQGDSGTGIFLEIGKVSPKRITAGWVTILARRNSHLEVIAHDLKFYGGLEHVPDAGHDRRRLVEGDLVRYQFWVGNYYLLRGVSVDFSAGTVVPLCSQKCTFGIVCQAVPIGHDDIVQLFDCPRGKPRKVPVRKASRVDFVEAYVEDIAALDTVSAVRDERPWLHVRIDGNDGGLSDPADMEKTGLPPVERAE
jgi:hypothetical protein